MDVFNFICDALTLMLTLHRHLVDICDTDTKSTNIQTPKYLHKYGYHVTSCVWIILLTYNKESVQVLYKFFCIIVNSCVS